MKNLAPIGILTYSRIRHLQRTVEALKENVLARASELFIFSDAPQKGDEKIVSDLRKYIHSIDGFKKVHIIEREINGRKNNSTLAQHYLLENYGKMIFIEDDVVTNKFFLKYLNDMLTHYENDKRIFGICAYSPDIKRLQTYKCEYFLSKRLSPCGFATWKDRGGLDAITNYDVYLSFLSNLPLFFKGYRISPKTIPHSLRYVYLNRYLRGDAMLFAKQLSNNQFSIVPTKSLVKNIGYDGSGVHCGIQPQYESNCNYHVKPITIIRGLKYNKEIDDIYCNFYSKIQSFSVFLNRGKSLLLFIKDFLFFRLKKKLIK